MGIKYSLEIENYNHSTHMQYKMMYKICVFVGTIIIEIQKYKKC